MDKFYEYHKNNILVEIDKKGIIPIDYNNENIFSNLPTIQQKPFLLIIPD
jgi:hypothetical protein